MKNNFLIIIFILGTAGLTGQNQASINASMKTAKMLERRGDIDGAIAVYKGVLLNSPSHHQSIRSLKSIYRNNQKYADGIQFLRERLAQFPNDIKTYSELGEFHFLNDQKKEARFHVFFLCFFDPVLIQFLFSRFGKHANGCIHPSKIALSGELRYYPKTRRTHRGQ